MKKVPPVKRAEAVKTMAIILQQPFFRALHRGELVPKSTSRLSRRKARSTQGSRQLDQGVGFETRHPGFETHLVISSLNQFRPVT